VTAPASNRKLSPSVAGGLSLLRKLHEGVELFREYRHAAQAGYDFDALFLDVDEYIELVERYSGLDLRSAQAFEIGFGARPYRQLIMQSMGIRVAGVDAEVPVLDGRPVEYCAMIRRNGVERAAKSLARRLVFDSREHAALCCAIRQRGLVPRLDRSTLMIGDAAELEMEPASLDLVFSEDVFEHIERPTLTRLITRIASWLRPTGVALIRPNVFTGITGGHLVEWSQASMRSARRDRQSDAWEHLRRRRFLPNTYLNEMTRAEYRELFRTAFYVVEERVRCPQLGREHLTHAIRSELASWSDDELFSNQTLFVLRPR
jgi:hypothetical protein